MPRPRRPASPFRHSHSAPEVIRLLHRPNLGSKQHRRDQHLCKDWLRRMDQVEGQGFAEIQPDGSLQGEIEYQHGDEFAFVAKKWNSSTAC